MAIISTVTLISLFIALILIESSKVESSGGITFSSRLIHRYSDELNRFYGGIPSPEIGSKEYLRRALGGDLKRQKMKMKLGHQRQLMFPSQGGHVFASGNDLGWLHYTWIDIGTPSVSFLVALDDGSDLLWVPCDCVQCAPLSAINYSSLELDKNLNEYSPDGSTTSKPLNCSHQLCDVGECKSATQSCPYSMQYRSGSTSSSGQLVEDILHLSSTNNQSDAPLKASVIFGCGKRQSGDYLDGAAPDGVLGLGLGEISVPSLLAKSGLIRNSFSLCFNDNGSGRIFFGDQGSTAHHWTPLLPLDGKFSTYVVGVDAFCVGKVPCLKQTSFHALIDSGTSFSVVPLAVYKKVVQEFDREANVARANFDVPWEYCYESSEQVPDFPSVKLVLSNNESFVVQNPIFVLKGSEGILGYCLALQVIPGDIGIIGQNFMTGYRMVFDRENMQFGWSRSDCQDHSNGTRITSTPSGASNSPNSLPTDEEQNSRDGHAVAPAIAGRAPSKTSDASDFSVRVFLSRLLCLLTSFHLLWNKYA